MSLKQRFLTGGITALTAATMFVAPAFAGNDNYNNNYGNNWNYGNDGHKYMKNYDNYNNNNCNCSNYHRNMMPYMKYMNNRMYYWDQNHNCYTPYNDGYHGNW